MRIRGSLSERTPRLDIIAWIALSLSEFSGETESIRLVNFKELAYAMEEAW